MPQRDALPGWIASWNSERSERFELYIDVVTPPVWQESRVRMVDLDLDVARTWDGEVKLLDEDEFAAHQVALQYPAELTATASETARQLMDRVASRASPFDGTGRAVLAELS